MLNQTNNRSHGRFIKKNDPVRNVMTINDFNLMEIMDKPVTYHDNANANIIHNRLHAEEELAEGVRDSFEINMSFPHESRPVIRPLDFTDEWKKQKKRQANRHHRLEEEEEFELDVTSLLKEKKLDFKKASFKVMETAAPKKDPHPKSASETVKPAVNLFPQAKAVKATPSPAPTPPAAPAPEPKAKAPTPPPPVSVAPEPEAFVPYVPTREISTPEAVMPRMEVAWISEEEKEKLRQEARAEGYQQGYQQGEEKGTLSAQDKINSITAELSKVIENLSGMQKSILTHVQDNFLMICQSFLEALLHREFRINPETFGAVIERAISDALPEDEFLIHVSPKAFQGLASWDPNMRRRLRIDEKLQDDHFRVEGKHAVVDGDLPKIIRELLDQADIQLFETTEKAG